MPDYCLWISPMITAYKVKETLAKNVYCQLQICVHCFESKLKINNLFSVEFLIPFKTSFNHLDDISFTTSYNMYSIINTMSVQ
jgi:hypothetical protein